MTYIRQIGLKPWLSILLLTWLFLAFPFITNRTRGSGDLYAEIFDMLASGGMFINIEHVASSTERLAGLWDRIRIDSLNNLAVQRGSNEERTLIEKEGLRAP